MLQESSAGRWAGVELELEMHRGAPHAERGTEVAGALHPRILVTAADLLLSRKGEESGEKGGKIIDIR